MKIASQAILRGVGIYAPPKILDNAQLEKMVDTNDEWIVQRTGVKERHISEPNEFASHMGIKAVEDLVANCNIPVDDVDLIILTTFTPDHFSPHTSALVQGHFGMKNCGTMDLGAGCTGFTYALCTADALVSMGQFKKVLVVTSETISKVTDYSDRKTCILFGDAATACVVERAPAGSEGAFYGSVFSTDGELAENVMRSGLSDDVHGVCALKPGFFQQDGQNVFKYVIRKAPRGIDALLAKTGLSMSDIDWFIPHSANMRIIDSLAAKTGFPMERILTSVEQFGNTSTSSIPLALWRGLKDSRVKKGDLIMFYGFGGGLTHGGTIVRW